ncbi:MAG: adenosylmethionine--8-amino-7-oxononanoate transaminase [Flavobacteriaceae bacterium]|nr:adenosylmethionine--8-amino-7-oxononanoate transaminase [Flavobacteriaceae bacterium]
MAFNQIDKDHLWHPYTQHKTAGPHPCIVRGKGAKLWDTEGKEYIDGIASWWVNPYGHANEFVAARIYEQLLTLEHVLFGGFTHSPAIKLAKKLLPLLPSNQQKIFFSDNGSTAVEVAIKMALQFHLNQGRKKSVVVAFENAFHGDTFGAMAASGIGIFTEAFKEMLLEVRRIPIPKKGQEQASLEALQKATEDQNVAAFIFEPLVQGAAGMQMYEATGLNALMRFCKSHDILTIADEVMTGFGKTGKNFACEYLTEQPDMMCLSKALTAGTIPMSLTTTTQQIFDAFYDDDINKALFHGHSFTANPTGCAAALASIELLTSESMQKNIGRINTLHKTFQVTYQLHPKIGEIRILGVIMAIELKTDDAAAYYGTLRNNLYEFFINNGLILRPVGNIIYVLPPYVITNNELQKIYDTIVLAIEKFV